MKILMNLVLLSFVSLSCAQASEVSLLPANLTDYFDNNSDQPEHILSYSVSDVSHFVRPQSMRVMGLSQLGNSPNYIYDNYIQYRIKYSDADYGDEEFICFILLEDESFNAYLGQNCIGANGEYDSRGISITDILVFKRSREHITSYINLH